MDVDLFDDNCYYVNTMGLFIVIIGSYIVKIIVRYLKINYLYLWMSKYMSYRLLLLLRYLPWGRTCFVL